MDRIEEQMAAKTEPQVILYGGIKPCVEHNQVEGSPIPIPRDLSPFCLKLMAYLSYRNVDYKEILFFKHNMKKSPRKQIPYVDFHGDIIPDSTNIIRTIDERIIEEESDRIDASMSSKARAAATCLEFLFENVVVHYITAVVMEKPAQERSKRSFGFYEQLPWGIRSIVWWAIKRNLKKELYKVGVSRYPKEEQKERVGRIFDVLDEALKDRPANCIYVSGTDCPCMADFTLYAFLSQIIFQCYYLKPSNAETDTPHIFISELLPRTAIIQYAKDLESAFFGSNADSKEENVHHDKGDDDKRYERAAHERIASADEVVLSPP